MSDIATIKIKFTIEQMDELKQLISDVNDAALYDRAQLDERIDALERENAKLRELVRDMWRFTGAACKKYPRLFDPSAQGGQMVQPNALESFEQRMRELGVEVDA